MSQPIFEIISRWNGWNEEEMGSSLASSLRGCAQQVLRDLPASEIENFDSIICALKRRFDPEEREESHKDHFKTRNKKKDESISEYGFALSRLAVSAYPRMFQKDREEIVIDQFINGLPSRDLQKHVKFGKPKSIDQALALATEYESFDGRFQGRKPEDHPEQPVRVIEKEKEDEELLKVVKQLMQKQKEMAQELQKVQKGMNQEQASNDHLADIRSRPKEVSILEDGTCTRCGDQHGFERCPADNKRCHKCYSFGHLSKKCTKRE